jgi:hypothetical protein
LKLKTLKVPFGAAKCCRLRNARYLTWRDAFDDGLSFLEAHRTIKKANKISAAAVPLRVSVPKKFRTHFKIEYDTGEVAEISWSFIRELPPKNSKKRNLKYENARATAVR